MELISFLQYHLWKKVTIDYINCTFNVVLTPWKYKYSSNLMLKIIFKKIINLLALMLAMMMIIIHYTGLGQKPIFTETSVKTGLSRLKLLFSRFVSNVITLNSTSILTSQHRQNALQVRYFPSFIVAILTESLRAETHHDTSRAYFLC